ncbi:hypothetical protein JL101_030100 (plasmid) [Skermanella rosea]|uniref:hypothetical protein n=1 Tax=Skermanella rosea TaxID=1817965 RepID=UPI0019315C2F|nr:hypothetical protein [Skermanella rosea]UEM06750.1 hypothetical protein JL101_030100 [Skermanella rosea]
MNRTISPFANESETLTIGNLTIENRADRVSIYGSIDLTRDKTGLEHARILKAVLDEVLQVLESESDLPDKTALADLPDHVENPFR